MTVESNKALIWRYFIEILNDHHYERLDEMFDQDFVSHLPNGEQLTLDPFLQAVRELQATIPDLEYTILDQVAERDRVAIRWQADGTPPRSEQSATSQPKRVRLFAGNCFYRIQHERIREHWGTILLDKELWAD